MLDRVTEELAIGNAAEAEKIQQIALQGYRTFIDLCPAQEGNQLNADLVEAHGLGYFSVPVYRNDINQNSLEMFMQIVESVPKPIYTRCVSATCAIFDDPTHFSNQRTVDGGTILRATGIHRICLSP